MSAEQQIEVLANLIAGNIPGEPSRSEGAGDCAVRLLGEYQGAFRAIASAINNAASPTEADLDKRVAQTTKMQMVVAWDEQGYCIVSDDVFLVYGYGDSGEAAIQDYVVSLIEYFRTWMYSD